MIGIVEEREVKKHQEKEKIKRKHEEKDKKQYKDILIYFS